MILRLRKPAKQSTRIKLWELQLLTHYCRQKHDCFPLPCLVTDRKQACAYKIQLQQKHYLFGIEEERQSQQKMVENILNGTETKTKTLFTWIGDRNIKLDRNVHFSLLCTKIKNWLVLGFICPNIRCLHACSRSVVYQVNKNDSCVSMPFKTQVSK